MRKNYFKLLIGSVLALSLNTQAQTNACNELFISEIVYAKDQIAISGNSVIDKSYAVELFNPKDTILDLTGYSIKLAKSNGADLSVNLTGTVTPKGKFTIAFSGSDAPLTAIADLLKSDLDFEEKTRLELWGPNGIIDRIGQVNLTQADVINIVQAIADPVNYLNTLNIDLTSLKNFTARRKHTEIGGDPIFTSPGNKWELAANGDITNLGTFNNVCSEVVEYWISYCSNSELLEGWAHPITVHADGIENHQIQHNVKLQLYNITSNPCLAGSLSIGNLSDGGLLDPDLDLYDPSNNTAAAARVVQFTDIANENSASSIVVYYAAIDDHFYEPQEDIGLRLTTAVNGTIDNNYSTTSLYIPESWDANGVQEIVTNELIIKSYPSPFNNAIYFTTNDATVTKIQLIDELGQTVFEEINPSKSIATNNVANGFYIIKFYTNDKVAFKKVIKQQ
jgi:hypothetical protein